VSGTENHAGPWQGGPGTWWRSLAWRPTMGTRSASWSTSYALVTETADGWEVRILSMAIGTFPTAEHARAAADKRLAAGGMLPATVKP
jgi:hypothetical protein